MAQPGYWQPNNTSKFPQVAANAIKVVQTDPVSTFSIDVDTASYGVVRNYLTEGAMPPADAVRVEEMVNYFDYAYAGAGIARRAVQGDLCRLSDAVEQGHADPAYRHQGLRSAEGGAAAGESRLPDRHVGLDG